MKTYKVEFSRRADSQLDKLYSFLAQKAGERLALQYMECLIADCMALKHFPNRGNLYTELGEGVRVIGFQDTVSIQFRVREDRVQILNLSYRGEDYVSYFKG